ncbi:hypothetical protein [Streptomyces sp. KL116D]|uniref:hypothetical protein n=1 Tax=Streptomyces sp. KL116D TaxID=3045152 RepID=UPI0035587C69
MEVDWTAAFPGVDEDLAAPLPDPPATAAPSTGSGRPGLFRRTRPSTRYGSGWPASSTRRPPP